MLPPLALRPKQLIDAATAISYLIAAGGNAQLAALNASQELHNDATSITSAQLMATIAGSATTMQSFANQVRVYAGIKVLDAFQMAHRSFMQTLGTLPAKDIAATYVKLADSMGRFSAPPSAPAIDPFEEVFKGLPPEVQEAIAFYTQKAKDDDATNAADLDVISQPNHAAPSDVTPTASAVTSAATGATPSTPPVLGGLE